MKKYTLFLFSTIASLFFAGCNQDLLNIRQHGVIDLDETYANADDETANKLISTVYNDVKYLITGDWGINYIATTTVKVGDFWPGGSDSNDGGNYQQMAALIDNTENGGYKDLYQRFYRIIYRSNMIVEKLNDQSVERRRVIAEAKAWRAWASMRLTQLWGSAPLVTHTLDGINLPFDPPNTDPADSWPWIMSQFDEAAADLPSKSGLGGARALDGRWTAEACYAYKGQGYMWQNKYDEAKVELAKVISSKKYALWTQTETLKDLGLNFSSYVSDSKESNTFIEGSADYRYLTLFRAKSDFCDEYMLELNIDGAANTVTSVEPYWFWAYVGWRNDEMYTPANTYAKNDGWGFVNPTRAFGVKFCKHDGNSVRRRAFIATFDEVYNDFPYLSNTVRGIMPGKKLFANQGFFRMKYYNHIDDLHEERFASGNAMGNTTNFPLMRYANVLLLYAEAVLQSGSEGNAGISGLEALNMVRRRAGLADAPALDMDNEMYGIKAERRFELCMEDCDRYVDLIRWGDYKNFVTNYTEDGVGDYWGTTCPWLVGMVDPSVRPTEPWDTSNYEVVYDKLRENGTWSDRLYYFPFPYSEMLINKNLVQNPGW